MSSYPAIDHCLCLSKAFEPYQSVVFLVEWWTNGLSVVSPNITLGADNVLPVEIKAAIELDRFRKVIPPLGDLINDGSVGGVEIIPRWGDGDEVITPELLENRVLIVPWPVNREKPEPERVSYRKVLEKWEQNRSYDQPREVDAVPGKDNRSQAGCFCSSDVMAKTPTAMKDVDGRQGKQSQKVDRYHLSLCKRATTGLLLYSMR